MFVGISGSNLRMYAHREGVHGVKKKKSIPNFLKGFRTEITQRYSSHTNMAKDKLTERDASEV